MNYSLNVKSSSIVHTLLSNCVKLLGKVQKLLIQCINYSVISKQIRVVSPKFYTVRKNFTGPPVPTVLTNSKSGYNRDHDHGSANKIRFLVIFKLNGVEISTLNIRFHFLSDYSCSNLHREYNHEFAKLLYSCTCFL